MIQPAHTRPAPVPSGLAETRPSLPVRWRPASCGSLVFVIMAGCDLVCNGGPHRDCRVLSLHRNRGGGLGTGAAILGAGLMQDRMRAEIREGTAKIGNPTPVKKGKALKLQA